MNLQVGFQGASEIMPRCAGEHLPPNTLGFKESPVASHEAPSQVVYHPGLLDEPCFECRAFLPGPAGKAAFLSPGFLLVAEVTMVAAFSKAAAVTPPMKKTTRHTPVTEM